MGRKSNQLQATKDSPSGKSQVTVQQHETDAPFLPVADLERLAQIKPDALEWFFKHTDTEANHRRNEDTRLNSLAIKSTYIGQVFALILGLAGIGAGTYIAIQSNPYAGLGVSVMALLTLAAGMRNAVSKKK